MAELNKKNQVLSTDVVELDVYQMIFHYLFIQQKMKIDGINRYEYEVISNINNHLRSYGVTKNAVNTMISFIDDAYSDFIAETTDIKNKVVRRGTQTIDQQGNPSFAEPVSEGDDIDPELKKRFVGIAQNTFKQDRATYLNIMRLWNKRPAQRAVFTINLNSSHFSSETVQSDKERLEIIAGEIETFVLNILENGVQGLHNVENSVIQFKITDATAWDMHIYEKALSGDLGPYKEAFKLLEHSAPKEGVKPLPISLTMLCQYTVIGADHVHSNMIVGLLSMHSTIKEYLKDFKEEKRSDANKEMPNISQVLQPNKTKKSNKDTVLSFVKNMFTGRVNEKPNPKPKTKIAAKGITVPEHMLEEYKKDIKKESKKNKPSLEKEGLLGFASYDEGGYILVHLEHNN